MKNKILVLILSLPLLAGCSKPTDNSSDTNNNNVNSDLSSSVSSMGNSKGSSGIAETIESWPPSTNLIKADLIGHSLTEGVKNGYRRSDWTFDIEEGDVSDLNIEEVLTYTDTRYLIIAKMKLSKGGNYYYDTKARINYIKSVNDDTPTLDYITSLGMHIVSDGEYDNDIVCEIVDDGWGGVNCLQIQNIGEVPLAVGGKVLANDEWNKFSSLVPPLSKVNVGGTFSGGSVTDYKVEFVCRDN